MPNNIIKSFAEKSGKSEKEVERLWNRASDIVATDYDLKKDDDKYYELVVGILKKMLGFKEEQAQAATTVGSISISSEPAGNVPQGGSGMAIAIKTKDKLKKRKNFKQYLNLYDKL